MMTEAEIYREHNSSFARWFKDHIDANPPPMDSDKDKLVLALSHGPAPNLMTYQAYDINGYHFSVRHVCTLIVVHPQHSHAVYLDSGRDKKKDYTNIGALLNDALTGFANKAGPLKVEEIPRRLGLNPHNQLPLPQAVEARQWDGRDADDICRVQGRVPGVYDDWEDCRRQVHRFSGNSYKGYPTRVEAEGRYARYLAGEMRDMRRNRMKTMAFVMMVIVTMLVMFYVIVV
ncbi:hypothetical protein QYE76_022443 [Lolium multiflorum]|uniref:Ribonuclease H1 N-terminal domain-containing protein n=1 Tax=Lolium multiflorum TaxID=4521 RepID=A0AAD8VT66_LOLMU|nr:hypothetical protein QYE76_022443 [Lolium multiflorum]